MATLTIKVDSVTANAALSSMTRQIELAATSSKTLSAVTATIAGHWGAADQAVKRYEASVRSASAATGTIAGQVKSITAEWLSAAAAVGKYNAAAKNAPTPSASGGFGGSYTGGAGFTAFSPVSVPRSSPQSSGQTVFDGLRGPVPLNDAFRITARDRANFNQRNQRPPPLPTSLSGGATIGRTYSSAAGDAFGAGFGALSGGLGKAITSTLSTATTIFGNGLASAASGVGGLILGGITGVVGAVGSALGSAFKAGLEVLESGIKIAVGILETGAKVALVTAAGLLANSVRLAIKEEPIKQGFEQIFGSNQQTGSLQKLREAARGTVDDIDLMTKANLAYQLGAVRSADETALLVDGARRLGKAVGRDATQAFNDLVVGIGRQSNRVLDNLGIIVRAEDEYEKYAKSVGTTSEKLSDSEKRLVFTGAAFSELQEKLKVLGPEQITAGDGVDRLTTGFSNLSAEIGSKFLPIVSQFSERWAKFLASFNADDIASGISAGFASVSKAGGGIADFIFGNGSIAAMNAKNFGASIYEAITNPSSEAFQVLAIRGEQFLVGLEAGFLIMWERFKAWGLKAIDDVVSALVPLNGIFEAVREATTGRSFAKDTNDTRDFNIANINKEAAGRTSDLEKLIAEIGVNRPQSSTAAQIPLSRTSLESGTDGFSAPPGGVLARRAAELAKETQAREAEQAAIMAAKEALDAQEKAIRAEIDMREGLLSQYRKEEQVNARRLEVLREATANARAARVGGADPNTTIAERLNKFAEELRRLPNVISDVRNAIADNATDMARLTAENKAQFLKARSDFSREIQGLTSSFLNQGPQDFETVRVRSIKRRFQRDRARSNAELVNNAFRGQSFGALGGDFGGLGIQDSERQGSPTNQRFPALENALLRLKDDRGETLLQQAQERIAALLAEQGARVEKVKAKQVELLATEKEALAAQKSANDGIIAALEESAAVQKQLAVNDSRAEAQAARIEADLAALKKALEEVARRAKR